MPSENHPSTNIIQSGSILPEKVCPNIIVIRHRVFWSCPMVAVPNQNAKGEFWTFVNQPGKIKLARVSNMLVGFQFFLSTSRSEI